MNNKDNLVWIDLEMTGLDPEHDVILEIASIITDKELTIVGQGPSLVIHHSEQTLSRMDEWSRNQHTKSGLLKKVYQSHVTTEEAEKKTLEFVKKHCPQKVAPLCGNSVWQDRIFLYHHMPTLLSYLHYRIIDVTSFKEVILRWYPDNPHAFFEKSDNHRAQDDIKESIEELRQYKKFFFISASKRA